MFFKKNIFAGLIFTVLSVNAIAGDNPSLEISSPIRKKKEKLSWIFGLGWNAVDDNGRPFKKLFAFRSAWNIRWYPTQASAEIIGKNGLTYGALFNFNIYKTGKEINSKVIAGSFPFLSFDGFAKYHFNAHIKMSKRYDPYIPAGLGYTLRFIGPYNSTFTFNIGAGINIWFNEYIGINFQTLGKVGLRSPFIRNGSNYMQHSGGIVYMLDRTAKKKHSFIKPRYKWVHDNHKLGERLR